MKNARWSETDIFYSGYTSCRKRCIWFLTAVFLTALFLTLPNSTVYGLESEYVLKQTADNNEKDTDVFTHDDAGQPAGTRIISVPGLKPDNIRIRDIKAGTVIPEKVTEVMGADDFFYTEEITDETFERMWKKSFKENCTTPREDLRYIRCLHCDIDGNIKVGELVMHKCVADTVCEIFRKLYDEKYPVESMILVDEFEADDETSIMSNNTSAFNFRMIDSTDRISNHAYGLAIDINPYYNVYYIPSEDYVFPPEGWEYLDREADFPYKLVPGDLCYNLFTEAGFDWGGWWTYNTDYQHFEYVKDFFEGE